MYSNPIHEYKTPLRKVTTLVSSFSGTTFRVHRFPTFTGGPRLPPEVGCYCSLTSGVRKLVFFDLRRLSVHSNLCLGRGQFGVYSGIGTGCGTNVGTVWDFIIFRIDSLQLEDWVFLTWYYLHTTKFWFKHHYNNVYWLYSVKEGTEVDLCPLFSICRTRVVVTPWLLDIILTRCTR